jgi:hypothetical protein
LQVEHKEALVDKLLGIDEPPPNFTETGDSSLGDTGNLEPMSASRKGGMRGSKKVGAASTSAAAANRLQGDRWLEPGECIGSNSFSSAETLKTRLSTA